MMIKKLMLIAGCVALLSGCTKSTIMEKEMQQEPDFNMYTDIEIDEEQLHADVDDIYLDEDTYPMAAAIDFELRLDEEAVDVSVVVKDGTSAEDAVEYAAVVIKGINDEVAVQDFSYGESAEDTFGGLYQDNVINLKIYSENDAEPMYETQVPKDTYMTFEF